MSSMFENCQKLNELNLSSFNTRNVQDMSYLFKNCKYLKNLTLGNNLNTGKVKYMKETFYQCENLISLDLRIFNTENVITMNRMFLNCFQLNYLDISSFRTPNLKDTE